LEKHSKLIVFYNFDYELEMLRSLAWQTPSLANTTSSSPESATSSHSSSSALAADPIDLPWKVEPVRTTSTIEEASHGSIDRSVHGSSVMPLRVAEWNGHNHQPIPKSERWLYLVQYASGAEGWNNTDTDAMLFWSMPYSYKMWHQAHGRIDRLNTPFTDLHYYVLKSTAFIDVAIERALASKQNFNESRYGWTIWEE